jgi:hypothetical protein
MRRTDLPPLLALLSLAPLFASCGSSASGAVAVTSASPEHASARGGDTITLQGNGFGSSPRVHFGGLEATVKSATDTAIEVIAPRTVAGKVSVDVEVSANHATLPGGFTFDALPLTFVDVAWPRVAPLPVDGGLVAIAGGNVFQAARREGVWIYESDGHGSFEDPELLPTDADPFDVYSVLAQDLDGDGNVDLFLGATGQTPTRVLFGDGALGFSSSATALPVLFGTTQTAIAADLDGDAALDLVTVGAAPTMGAPPSVVVLRNDGHGRFTDVTAERLPGGAFNAAGVAAGDVDGDGDVDLFFAGTTEASRLYLNDGHGVFQRAAPDALPNDSAPGAGVPALGDLDGDGSLDIYVPRAGHDSLLFNDGTGHFVDLTDTHLGPDAAGGTSAALADLDLDGHLDVVVVTQPGQIRLLHNDGTGRLFDYSGEMAGNGKTLLNAGVAIGDLDDDGDLDLFVSRSGFARAALFASWAPLPLHDQDGDGFPDEIDSCPAAPSPDQANVDSLPFRCDSTATCQAETKCDLVAHGTSAYLICGGVKATWTDASTACAARGGHLVTIASEGDTAFLLSLGVADAWIGFTDATTEGTFAWASGESTYTNWGMAQPDDAGGKEDCAVILVDGTWNDAPCDQPRGYICQDVRRRMPDPGDACDSCSMKYEPGSSPVILGDAGTCAAADPDAGAP